MGFLGNVLGGGSNGLGSPVTQAQNAIAYSNAMQGLYGALNSSNQLTSGIPTGMQTEQNAINQMQGVANGTGPNPAQMMLNQATQQNIQQQAAMMGGQRGVSANPGLLARQSAMMGDQIQQQGAGQAATLGAQQQLGAMQGLGQMGSNQVVQGLQAQGAYNQVAQNQQSQMIGGLSNYNAQQAGLQSSFTNAGMGLLGATTQAGGMLGAASIMAAKGGEIEKNKIISPFSEGPKSKVGMHLKNPIKFAQGGMAQPIHGETFAAKGKVIPGKAKVSGNSLKNDNVPALLSPGEVVIPRSVMNSKDPVKNAAQFIAAVMAKKKGEK